MKLHVIGFEINEGLSKKTGNPYAIGRINTMIPISGSKGAKGFIGHSYDCEVSILRKLEHLTPPFNADVEVVQVMKYGQPTNEVVSVVPSSLAPIPASK